jgi:starch-binding outer membrane protein, SusD/RagB family
MLRWSTLVVAAAAIVTVSCDLNISNPNDPDKIRSLGQPSGLQQLLGGAVRTWVETRENYYVMPLNAQADNYTASWNNAAMRFYSSVGSDCPIRCGWTNSSTAPEAAGGPTVEVLWYGYYNVLTTANAVLNGIETLHVCFDDDCSVDSTLTQRNKAVARMLQGMSLAGIAMIYDQGFVVDETTDLSAPKNLPFSTRQEVRDAALAKLSQAYTEAGVEAWTTDPEWSGIGSGTAYTNVQIQQLIRTMQAELIALYPRNSAENTAADWAAVANYASQGISSGTPFTYQYYIDQTTRECGVACIKTWGNSVSTERVDTRVAAILTTNHQDPWPVPNGNPCPTVSADKRVGDGTYGPAGNANYNQVGITNPATANAGTDYACAGVAIFPPARGSYHQSNLSHVRYHWLAYRGEDLPADDGTGQDPLYTTQMNDLLWAEGLIRSNGDLNLAAQKIDNSRVTRGGLASVAGQAAPALIAALQYEQEIEFMGQGVDAFFNRRRSGYNAAAAGGRPPYVDGLVTGTPRHMPVPAKELDILTRAVYSFGGPNAPDMSSSVNGGQHQETVRDRFRALQNARPGYLTRFLPSDMRF